MSSGIRIPIFKKAAMKTRGNQAKIVILPDNVGLMHLANDVIKYISCHSILLKSYIPSGIHIPFFQKDRHKD